MFTHNHLRHANMAGSAGNVLGDQFSASAPSARYGAFFSTAVGGCNYTRSAPAQTPAPADAGAAEADLPGESEATATVTSLEMETEPTMAAGAHPKGHPKYLVGRSLLWPGPRLRLQHRFGG